MKETWLTPKEIAAMPGMPTTIQGIHKKAKREGWCSRRKKGIQGPAVEYYVTVSSENSLFETEDKVSECSLYYENPVKRKELENLWRFIFRQLSDEEAQQLIGFFLKEGVGKFIKKSEREDKDE